MTSRVGETNGFSDILEDTEKLEKRSTGVSFYHPKKKANQSQGWTRGNSRTCRNLKIAGVAAIVLFALVGVGIAMHTTLGLNSAGFHKLWAGLTANPNLTVGQVLLYAGLPAVGLTAIGYIGYNLIACFRAQPNNKYTTLNGSNDDKPWVPKSPQSSAPERDFDDTWKHLYE